MGELVDVERRNYRGPRVSDLLALPFEIITGTFVAAQEGLRMIEERMAASGSGDYTLPFKVTRASLLVAATASKGARTVLTWPIEQAEKGVLGRQERSFLGRLHPFLDLKYAGWYSFDERHN